MIQKITDFIFHFIGIRILGCNDNLRCLFSDFLEDLVNTLIKKIIRIGTFLWMFLFGQ